MEYLGADLILSYSSSEKKEITYESSTQDIPFLYLGGKNAAETDHQFLHEAFSITHILNVSETPNVIVDPLTSDQEFNLNDDERNIRNQDETIEQILETKSSPIQTLHLPFYDVPNGKLEVILPQALSFIEQCFEQKGCLLVHCRAGVSRSASVVVAFIISRFGLNLKKALQVLKEKRPSIGPNFGFIYKLKHFERKHCEEKELVDSISVEEVLERHWFDYEMVREWPHDKIAELFSMEGDFDENVELVIKENVK